MGKQVGALIKEARTAAGLSQTKLAELLDNVTASDIGKAERGEKDLSQAALKQIAKATGVTQSSLINAYKAEQEAAAKKTAKKPAATTAKKTATATKKTATSTAAKKTASAKYELTASEKKLVDAYRAADSETRKNALKVLKGEANVSEGLVGDLLSNLSGGAAGGILGNLLKGE